MATSLPARPFGPTASHLPRARERFSALSRLSPALVALGFLAVYIVAALVVPHQPPRSDAEGLGYTGPTSLTGLMRWDGGWYGRIAELGYQPQAGRHQPYAFFPLFPAMAALLHLIVPVLSTPTAGILVNVAAVCGAALLMDRLLRDRLTATQRCGAIAFLLAIPSAFFYAAFYSEAIFLVAVALTLWAVAEPGRLRWAPLGVVLATLDRPVGILLVLLLVTSLRRGDLSSRNRVGILAASCAGVPIVLAFFTWTAGDPFAFVHAQAAWTSLRTLGFTDGVRWVVGTMDVFGAGFSVVALGYWEVIAAGVFLVVLRRRLRPVLPYCAAVLVTCFVTGGVGTQSRYLVTLLPLWLAGLTLLREQGRRVWWTVVTISVGSGLLVNLWLIDRFVQAVWAG